MILSSFQHILCNINEKAWGKNPLKSTMVNKCRILQRHQLILVVHSLKESSHSISLHKNSPKKCSNLYVPQQQEQMLFSAAIDSSTHVAWICLCRLYLAVSPASSRSRWLCCQILSRPAVIQQPSSKMPRDGQLWRELSTVLNQLPAVTKAHTYTSQPHIYALIEDLFSAPKPFSWIRPEAAKAKWALCTIFFF